MKINVYQLEIDETDEISVSGVGPDSFLRINESNVVVVPNAIDRLLDAVTELRLRLSQEVTS